MTRAEVVVRDALEWRSLRVDPALRADEIAVHVTEATSALAVVPPLSWSGLRAVRSRPVESGWLTVLRFDAPVAVAAVVEEVRRQAGPVAPLSPVGFVADAHSPALDLVGLGPLSVRLVESLRAVRGVRVAASDDPAIVAGLAQAGVPLVGSAPPGLPRVVAAAVEATVDLDDALAREEHSVMLRRAAFDATYDGALPAVSVVLATRRPEMLEHALAQVARQRGVDLELVLAPHGFDPGPVALPGVPLTVLPQPADAVFGDVLQAAALAASGEVVLKMDDDDWYGPEVVADLLRARAYSGAQLVGMPAEMHYLTEQDVTVRRGHTSEHFASFVAGGTMMVDRSLLMEVGGFRPVRKYVDAQLLAAVAAAGGATYRTHGLGYVLRRNPAGHTWQADLDYLLDPARVAEIRPGFAPSRLMELA